MASSTTYSLHDMLSIQNSTKPCRVTEEISLGTQSGRPDLESLRASLERNVEELDNPDQPFSPEEGEEWVEKLVRAIDDLESRLGDDLDTHQNELNQLRNELEELKKKVHVMPKKTWVRAAGNKFLNFFETASITAIKALTEGAVKGLLTGG